MLCKHLSTHSENRKITVFTDTIVNMLIRIAFLCVAHVYPVNNATVFLDESFRN